MPSNKDLDEKQPLLRNEDPSDFDAQFPELFTEERSDRASSSSLRESSDSESSIVSSASSFKSPKEKLAAKQSIADDYRKIKNGELAVSPHKKLTIGTMHDTGKYKPRAFDAFGYAAQTKEVSNFKMLMEQLALMGAEDSNFKYDISADEIISLFNAKRDSVYVALNQDLVSVVAKLSDSIINKRGANDDTNIENLKEFIQKVVCYRPRKEDGYIRDDRECRRNYIAKLLKQNKFQNLNLKGSEIAAIIQQRKHVMSSQNEKHNYLRQVKKCFNHYLLEIDSSIRIQNLKKQAGMEAKPSIDDSENPELKPDYVSGKFDDTLKAEKTKTAIQKGHHATIAKVVGSQVGIGEGVVVFVTGMQLCAPLGPAIAIPFGALCFLSGALFNYYLVTDDTKVMLNKLRLSDLLNNMPTRGGDYSLYLAESDEAFQRTLPKKGEVCIHIFDGTIHYKVIDPNGEIAKGTLSNVECDKLLKETKSKEEKSPGFNTVEEMLNAFKRTDEEQHIDAEQFKKFKRAFLEITADKGHTDSFDDQQIKRDFSIVLGGSSLSAGLSYGALSAIKLATLMSGVLGAAHVGGLAALGIAGGMALPPVALTTLGLFSIYFFVITDLIAKERWIDIKNYFLEKFVDVGWSDLKGKDFAKQLALCAFEIFKLLVVVGIATLVSVISCRLFHEQVVGVVSVLMNMSNAVLVGYIVSTITTVVTGVFGIKKSGDLVLPMTLGGMGAALVMVVPRLVSLVLKVVHHVWLFANLCVWHLPYLYAQALRMVMINVPTYILQLSLSLVNVLVRVVLNPHKLVVALLTGLATVPLWLVGAVLMFAPKLIFASLYAITFLASLASFRHYKFEAVFHALVKTSRFCEKPAMAIFALAAWLSSSAENFTKWFDERVLNTSKATNKVDGVIKSSQNALTDVRHAARAKLFGGELEKLADSCRALTNVAHNVSPARYLSQKFDKHVVDPLAEKLGQAVLPKEENGQKSLSQKVEASCDTLSSDTVLYAAVSKNSVTQGLLFGLTVPAKDTPGWVLRTLSIFSSTTNSMVPNVTATQASIRQEMMTEPKGAIRQVSV